MADVVKTVRDEDAKVVEKSDSSLTDAEFHPDAMVEDPALDRRILWKRDLLLIPLLGFMYMIMFLDRTNIANARIEGLEASLKMPSNGYNTCLWIFYIPFVLAEIPSNLLLAHFTPRYLLGAQVLILGILGFCQGLTGSYQGLLAIRFFLGTFESALPAGAAYLLSLYYTKKESAVRFALFFVFAILGPFFSGLLAYAIENLDGTNGMEGWRWIFIIEGLMTVFISFFILAFLPNFPEKAQGWFLKPHERERLVYTLRQSRGDEKEGSPLDEVPLWKILIDWRIHLFTCMFFCCDITASSMAGFAPTILTQLGWTAARAQVMTMPVWGTGAVCSLIITYIAAKSNFRTLFMLFCIALQLAGWIIMRVYPAQAAVRYGALFLLSAGTFPQMPSIMAWLAMNLRGRRQLAVGMAWNVSFGNAANFVASNVFITAESPKYPTGFSTGLGFTALGFILTAFCGLFLAYRNRANAKRRETLSEEEKKTFDAIHVKYAL